MFAETFCEVAAMSSQSQRFANATLSAFRAAGLHTDAEVAAAGGPSTTTMTSLRKAARGEIDLTEPRSDTMRRIEVAAGWSPGTGRRLWANGTPGERSEATVTVGPTREELRELPVAALRVWLSEGAEGAPPNEALYLWSLDALLEDVRRRAAHDDGTHTHPGWWSTALLAQSIEDSSAFPVLGPEALAPHHDSDADRFLRAVVAEAVEQVAARRTGSQSRGQASRSAQDADATTPDPEGPEGGA